MYYKCCVCESSRQVAILHHFPCTEKRLAKWLKCLNRDDLNSLSPEQLSKLFVCQKHFEKKFITSKSRLIGSAYPSLFAEDEILTGTASRQNDENVLPQVEHSYSRKRHFDHTYSQEPLKESLNDEQRRKQLEMREERREFYSRRTGISVIPEVEDIIEQTTCSVADDINDDEEVEVCRVCLALDVKMYDLRDTELKTMFQNITGISLNETDHAILGNVCWECAARLKAAATFRSKALLSDSLLQDLINNGEQIRKRDITTIQEKEDSLTTTLTAIEVYHIVDIEDQNVTQPLQSDEDGNQPLLSEHDDMENNIIIEIQQENTAMDVEEDEINVPIKFEIEDYLCFNTGEENNQDRTFAREDTINLVNSSSLLDTGVPLLETRIKTQKKYPKDCTSSRENTITAAHGGPLLDVGLSSFSKENCDEQRNKNVNKRNSNSEMKMKILPEQTTKPNKRRKEATRYGHTYLKAVTKVRNKKKK